MLLTYATYFFYNFIIKIFNSMFKFKENRFFEISDLNEPTRIQSEHNPWPPETRRPPY